MPLPAPPRPVVWPPHLDNLYVKPRHHPRPLSLSAARGPQQPATAPPRHCYPQQHRSQQQYQQQTREMHELKVPLSGSVKSPSPSTPSPSSAASLAGSPLPPLSSDGVLEEERAAAEAIGHRQPFVSFVAAVSPPLTTSRAPGPAPLASSVTLAKPPPRTWALPPSASSPAQRSQSHDQLQAPLQQRSPQQRSPAHRSAY